MITKISVILACCLFAYATATTYPTIGVSTLKKVFDGVKPYSDLSNAFYSVKGLHLLGETLPTQSHAVNFLLLQLFLNSIMFKI
jgi:hypothetical protein